jgi:hypothetical protein
VVTDLLLSVGITVVLGFLHFIPTGSAGLVCRIAVKLCIVRPFILTSDTAFVHHERPQRRMELEMGGVIDLAATKIDLAAGKTGFADKALPRRLA